MNFKHPINTDYSFEQLVSFSKSQAGQDLFVLAMFEAKTNGTFLEIGSGYPKRNSNCYFLEKYFAWSGTSIDIKVCENAHENWNIDRPRSDLHIVDAVCFDYSTLPSYVDYLQLDIDDPVATATLLEKLQHITFGTLTVEHDIYSKAPECYALKNFARRHLIAHGYVLLADNIICARMNEDVKNRLVFEDWYVHADIISKEIIETYKQVDYDTLGKFYFDVLFK